MGRPKLEKKKVQMAIMVTEEVRDYLRSLHNYSKYINDLIETDRITAKDLDETVDSETKAQLNAILTRLFGGK